MQLAYLMPRVQLEPTNLIMLRFLQALLTAAAAQRYQVLVVAQQEDPGEDIRRLARARSVDAFVLSDLQRGDPRAELLSELGMPFACFGRTGPGLPQAWADVDNVAAEAQIVRHVVGCGFTRPGYVGFASANYWDAEREAGFRAGLAAGGLAGAGLLRLGGDAGARAELRSFICSARPDAIIAGSDQIAVLAYGVAAELGLSVGRDLAVAGFDGSVSADLLHPSLTTAVIPVDDIARRVVARAIGQVGQADTAPGEILPATLRAGGSTRAPGAAAAQPDAMTPTSDQENP
jgi:DNA-binding LacI/PurR family transcriptional regulator